MTKLSEGFVPLAKPFPREIDRLGNLAQPLFAAINGANAQRCSIIWRSPLPSKLHDAFPQTDEDAPF
ncbi:hypothetical protein H6F93_14730 [Leptolyngbya sp. FACHB-671]|uniref:hypothetical protein n=1 Tax=Leptolyngbya sp. FACHB-671 TaxID=2692812 RepID=UPI0016895B5A|nr:hypothetical protein [Leptolyngbya sp. FACHB-671]MBD2068763.1 hypothetical protein [Leptolyngbya sp. FACHB-671]